MAQPLQILGGAYSDDARPWSDQDTCNYILFPAEKPGTRTEGQLVDAPGLYPFSNVGTGPHRGARDVEGKCFVVSGTKLYQVSVTGVATELGTIPGTGRVSMTHNQIADGNEVVIGTLDNSYVYNTTTGVLAATGVALFSVDFLNQMVLGVDPERRFWRYSGLANAMAWNTLDNESAESSPDRIVGGIVSQGEWLVFGERTIEVWNNSPTTGTAFQRSVVIERGCANGDTICRLDNSVFFLGNDNIVYRLDGYSPRPISTSTLTKIFSDCDPAKAFAFTYEDRGRVVYYLTHSDGRTFGYDVTTQEWHRRESYGFKRWRLATLFKWDKAWYGGDFADGTLYRLNWRYMKEGCDELVRYRRSGVLHGNQSRVTVNSVEWILDPGRVITDYGVCGTTDNFLSIGMAQNWPTTLYGYKNVAAMTVDTQPPALAQYGSWSPTGSMFAAALVNNGQAESLYLYRRNGAALERIVTSAFNNSGPAYGSAWSASHFAYCRQNTPHVYVYSYAGETFTQITTLPNAVVTGRAAAVDYSADGSLLAVAVNGASAGDPALSLYSVSGSTYTLAATIADVVGDGNDVKFTPGFLAFAHSSDPGLAVYSVAGTTLTEVFKPGFGATCCDWSEDGRFLAVLRDTSTNRLTVYERSGSTFTSVYTETITGTGNFDLTFTDDALYVALGGDVGGGDPDTNVRAYAIGTWTRVAAKEFNLNGDLMQFGLSAVSVADTSPPDDSDVINFRYSKDGGQNDSDWQHREIGETGNFKRTPPFRRLGMSRQWVFEIRNTSSRPCAILGAVAEIE